jgi:hypothetical protein
MEARVDQMIAAVTDTGHALRWAAVAAAAATLLLRMTTITTVAAPLAATAPVATITAVVRRPASFTIDVKEVTDAPLRVVEWEDPMSMVHRARVTLTMFTIPGPDHLLVAMMTPT